MYHNFQDLLALSEEQGVSFSDIILDISDYLVKGDNND